MASDTFGLSADDISMQGGPGTITVPFSFVVNSSATPSRILNTAGQRLYLAKIPKNSTLVGFFIDLPDLDDTGTAFKVSVGDTANQYKWVSSATVGQATGKIRCPTNIGPTPATVTCVDSALPTKYTSADAVVMTLAAAPGTAFTTTRTVKGWIRYTPFQAN